MTIGELIRELEKADPALAVYYDFCRCVPGGVDSWRGIYAEPALGWEPTGYSARGKSRYPTVGEVLGWLREASDGRTEFTGWKGGTFTYSPDSPLHIDNPGDYTQTELSGVVIGKYEVTLVTRRDDD